jgi:hypothetical protein
MGGAPIPAIPSALRGEALRCLRRHAPTPGFWPRPDTVVRMCTHQSTRQVALRVRAPQAFGLGWEAGWL